MPLDNYGVWVGYPRRYIAEKQQKTPHLQLWFDDDVVTQKGKFRAAINIKSATNESRLVYWFVRNLNHPITEDLAILEPGWHKRRTDDDPALDYIRGGMINLEKGKILAHNVAGEDNDIIDFVSPILDEAIRRKATIYLFGEQFPNGIHDVHMNQGNSEESFAKYNGVFQDGGVLLHFPDDGHWEGIFLAFAVQIVHTTDKGGDPIGDTSFVELIEGSAVRPDVLGVVIISAALVNPIGPDENPSGESEAVLLVNTTLSDIQLDGWTMQNRNGDTQALSGVLRKQHSRTIPVPGCPLTNRGGTITLLNPDGLKVDGVSYSRAQASREGRLVLFH
jgi:uncharacterized protein YukJ